MQPSNYLLDHFVGHKLSLLTVCGAPEITRDATWINTFILTSVIQADIEPKTRAFLFNFLRRAEGAFLAYRQAHAALLDYIGTSRNVLSPYFKALLNFEICIGSENRGQTTVSSMPRDNRKPWSLPDFCPFFKNDLSRDTQRHVIPSPHGR